MALSATWTAIVSTDGTDAATNIGATTSGIYRLDGSEVAAGTTALSDASNVDLLSPILIDQNGNISSSQVYSGTGATRIEVPGRGLGDNAKEHGYNNAVDSSWIDNGTFDGTVTDTLPLYAISSTLTVPASAPEPTTIGLFALGGRACSSRGGANNHD